MKKHSVTFYILLVLAIWSLFTVTTSLIIAHFAIQRLQDKVSVEKEELLHYHLEQTDLILRDSYMALSNTLVSSEAILRLQMSDDPSVIATSKSQIFKELSSISSSRANIRGFFFYCPEDGLGDEYFGLSENGAMTTRAGITRKNLHSFVRDSIEEGKIRIDRWTSVRYNDINLLFCLLETRGCYAGYYMNMDSLLCRPEEIGSTDSVLYIEDDSNHILSNNIPESSEIISVPGGGKLAETVTFGGHRYMKVSSPSGSTGYRLTALIPETDILSSYAGFFPIVISYLILTALFGIMMILVINKVIGNPVRNLYNTTERIRHGHPDDRVSGSTGVVEFDTLGASINNMLDETKQLRIDLYEKELHERQVVLDYLQIQVEPHFFLNCLNLVYSLAELEKLEDVKKLSLSLSKYFRFRFHKSTNLIPLKEELEHVQNYIDIQAVRFGDNFSFSMKCDEGLDDALLPPLSIQTFVENSIKYALSPRKKNSIEILCEKMHDLLKVTIKDNGKGYSADVLQVLNSDQRFDGDDTRRIGITNVKERLNLLFGDNSYINFYNNNGSIVEFVIPITKEETGDVQDPASR